MRKSKVSWDNLLHNDKIIFLIALFLAFLAWLVMMNSNTDENQTWKVDDVPIIVEYSTDAVEAGYKVFDTDKSSVAVSITGNSLTIRQVKPEQIEVVAAITGNAVEGENTISLSARRKNGLGADFSIASVEPGTLTAYIGVAKEKIFTIESNIIAPIEENYYARPPQLNGETITISGPAEVIDKVKKVCAEHEFEAPINETKEFTADLVLYDENNNEIESPYITMSKYTLDVKLTVLWKQDVELIPTYTNRPSLFPSKLISVSAQSSVFAGPKEAFDNLSSIALSPIDFTKVNVVSNSFSVDILSPEELTNIGNNKAVNISFNLTGYVEKWFFLSYITPINVPIGTTAQVYNDAVTVLVVGPAKDVNDLTSADLSAQVNLSGADASDENITLPISVNIKDNNTCWVYGAYRTSVYLKEDR